MNNRGFGYIETFTFLFILIICLVLVVILYHKNFDMQKPEEKVEIEMIGNSDNVDVIDNYVVEKEEIKESNNFVKIEEKLVNTAKLYINDNFDLKNSKITIPVSKLIEKEYISDIENPNDNKKTCDGYINYDGIEDYKAYIKCADDYETIGYNYSFQ